jgi:iron complex transport system substrate-binding protein
MSSSYAPRRIASLQPSVTVILAVIGELQRIVACTRYCADVVPEISRSSRTIVADSWTPNAEEIVAAKPDLVIAAVPYQEKAISEILKSGARFLGLAPKTLSDIYTDIATIAGTVGAIERGEEVIGIMQRHIQAVHDQVRARLSHSPQPKVFCEEWGKPIIASQTWVAELVQAAGGCFLSVPGQQILAEEVARMDPDIIIASWCGAGDRVPLEKIIVDRGWQQTAAARSGRVFCIRDEFLNTPAPTLLHGLDALAHAVNPTLFPVTKGIRQITFAPNSPVPNPAR